MSQGFQAAAQQGSDRRDGPAEVVGDLLKRLAANKDPHARLATRLKSMSEQDGRAVVLYMDDLIAKFRAGQKTAQGER